MLFADDRDYIAFTVFWGRPNDLAGYIVSLYARPDYPRELRITQNSGPPTLSPQDYNPPFRLYQLWTPQIDPSFTVLYPNYQDGGSSLVRSIAQLYGIRAVSLRLSSPKVTYPICEFKLHDRSPDTRIVRAMKDSRWEFLEIGTQQPFEQPEHYSRRVVRERFDIKLAVTYCRSLGLEIDSPQFWATSNCTTMNIRA